MRKVTFGGATSLDNFLARKDDSVDWLVWSQDVAKITGPFWKTVDTVLMGRRTYEVALRAGSPAYPSVKNYVFSRSLKKAEGNVELISTDAVEFVRELKHKPGNGICVMGGGLLAQSLFEADLIDEVGLNIHPVMLGSGISVFHQMNKQIDLELLECRKLERDCVYVLYRVKHSAD